MALFGRSARKKLGADNAVAPEQDNATEAGSEKQPTSDPEPAQNTGAVGRGVAHGPWDETEAPEIGKKVDLGSIWLPGIHEMTLRMEVDKKTQVMTGTAVVSAGSALQVQAFAAPKTEGIWDEIRTEIFESLKGQGASVDEIGGPFGHELLAQIDATNSEGKKVRRVVRFLGVDGPRWFVRGVITGKAAVDAEAAKPIEELFSNITVLRDGSPRAPREVLPMTVPQRGLTHRDATDPLQQPEGSAAQKPEVNPLEDRGPEITEIR